MPRYVLRGSRKPIPMATAAQKAAYRRRRAPARRMVGKSNLAAVVNRLINRKEETKYVADAPADNAGHSLAATWTATPSLPVIGSYLPAIPPTSQGTDDFERIGNKIAPKSLAMSVRVGFDAKDLSCNSIYGVIYYGTCKSGKTWQGSSPVNSAAILDDGQGGTQTWGSLRQQLTFPVDKKQFNLKRIVFRLGKSAGVLNNENGNVNGNLATSSGPSERTFLLRFSPPKSLLYTKSTDTFPQNYAPFWGIGFCHTDGSAITTYDNSLMNVSSRCHLYFKDA